MQILDDLTTSVVGAAPSREVRIGAFLTAVCSRACGLASTVGPVELEHGTTAVRDAGDLVGRSALDLARLAYSDSSMEASVGLAAINSLLEVDETRCVEVNAGNLLVERGRAKNVALIGHFPFVPSLRQAARHLWVLELRPQPGDVSAEQAAAIVPQADVVAITGSALINHTIERLLSLCRPDSFVVVLGPTTPLSPVLFDYGVDVICGVRIVDEALVLRCVSEGATFRQMRGVRLLAMQREAAA